MDRKNITVLAVKVRCAGLILATGLLIFAALEKPVNAQTAPPVITSLSPSAIIAGSPGFTLTVGGTGFTQGAVVQWNGAGLQTTFGNSSQLTASVAANLIVTAGSARVTVVSGAVASNTVNFQIIVGPIIGSLNPGTAIEGGPAFTLTVNGGGFAQGAVVQWNGGNLTTTVVSTAQLRASVPANLIAKQGTAAVRVLSGDITSSPVNFTISAAPAISSLSPSTVPAGSPAFALTVNGSGFAQGAAVLWNSTGLQTNFVNPSQLTASVPQSLVAGAGTAAVTVVLGGVTSNTVNFQIAGGLAISSLNPNAATAGGPAFTLTVNGSGFAQGTIVQWNGANLTTTFGTASQLTASVPASLIATPGTAAVRVVLGTGFSSAPATFTISAGPAISSLNPNAATAGGSAFTLTVNGSGFAQGAIVQWNGGNLTTFGTASQLTASVPASLIAAPGTAAVRVVSGGVTSAAANFTISAGPAISSLNPNAATAGGPAFTLTVNGSGFAQGAIVQWNGANITTAFGAASQLTASVPASLIATAGIATVRVVSGGVTSSSVNFTISAGLAISSLNPSTATAGGPAFTLTVNGSAFAQSAIVQWNGTGLQTTFVNSSQLAASVPPNLIAGAGTAMVTVLSGGVTSNSVIFQIAAGPTISSLNPNAATAGGPAFTLTVNGSGFAQGAIVQWNGANLTTAFGAASQLTASVPASLIASAGIATVRVVSGGVTSASVNFTISAGLAITSLNPNTVTAGGPAFTLTVNGSGFAQGAIVQWNGTGLTTTFVDTTRLTASIPSNLILSPGSAAVTVLLSEATSNSLNVSIVSGPAISSLSPNTVTAGGPAFTLTVGGSGFAQGAVVLWNGASLTASFVDTTRLTVSIPSSLILSPGSAAVTVLLSGATSNSLNVSIVAGPAISSLSPSAATAGGPAFTLTVNGSGFAQGAVVQWNGVNLTTTLGAAAQLTASVSASLIATAGTAAVRVVSGGVPSSTVSFTISAGPVISSLSPSAATAGGPAFTLTVNGSAFAQGAIVQWNGTDLATTFVDSTQLTASVSATLIATAGTAAVRVFSGGVFSATTNVTIVASSSILAVSPGALVFTYQISGNLPSSQGVTVTSGGAVLTFGATTSVSTPIGGAWLSATPSNLSTPGNLNVSVNPAGLPPGAFNGNITITAPGAANSPVVVPVTLNVSTLPVPTITINGPQSTPSPTDVINVGLELNGASPTVLEGTLRLSFRGASGIPNNYQDPFLRFAAGGTDLNFTVPAGATVASLPQNGAIQQGTVAGDITVTLTRLVAGTVSVLPESPTSRTVSILRGVPVITPNSVRIVSLTASTFNVELNGYSTPRDLSTVRFTFEAAADAQIEGAASFTVDVGSLFTQWYAGSQGLAYGSMFRLQAPFTIQGNPNLINSVTVTLTNSVGPSNPVRGGRQ